MSNSATNLISVEPVRPIENVHCCEACQNQFFLAQKEVAAFAIAIRQIFGADEERLAIQDWIEIAERCDGPLNYGYPNWRLVTVAAAERLAGRRA